MTSINHAPAIGPGFPRAPLCTLWFKVFDGRSRSSTEPRQTPEQAAKILPAHQPNAFGELRMCRLMSRLLKALPLTLALAVLTMVTASCGSSNAPAQVRFVHAIQDAPALDIAVTGPNTASMPEFTHLSFLDVQPAQPGYTSVP